MGQFCSNTEYPTSTKTYQQQEPPGRCWYVCAYYGIEQASQINNGEVSYPANGSGKISYIYEEKEINLDLTTKLNIQIKLK